MTDARRRRARRTFPTYADRLSQAKREGCAGCLYFQPIEGGYSPGSGSVGECRFNPPFPLPFDRSGFSGRTGRLFPTVDPSEWCGQWADPDPPEAPPPPLPTGAG